MPTVDGARTWAKFDRSQYLPEKAQSQKAIPPVAGTRARLLLAKTKDKNFRGTVVV
jgi:hypothetical protein